MLKEAFEVAEWVVRGISLKLFVLWFNFSGNILKPRSQKGYQPLVRKHLYHGANDDTLAIFLALQKVEFSQYIDHCTSRATSRDSIPSWGMECPPPNATTCPYRLRGPPSWLWPSVTDFWDWGTHRAQLRCPVDVSDDMYERGVPGWALNLNSTGYPDHGPYGDLPLQGKTPMAESGIEPGTSWLVVRNADLRTTRLVVEWSARHH
jgi:hypothetical protein